MIESPPPFLPYIHRNRFLGILNREEQELLASQCKLRRCSSDRPIWVNGNSADFVGMVTKGLVRMVRSSSLGKDMTIELFGVDEVFGVLGIVSESGCPLTAIGTIGTEYLEIPKCAFLSAYHSNPSLKDSLLRRSSIRLHEKIDLMAKLSQSSAEGRLATVLLMIAESHSVERGDMLTLDIQLSRQLLAEMAGLTTETAIRVISRWTKEGIISTKRQKISILRSDEFRARYAN